jgi:hypothetical protein
MFALLAAAFVNASVGGVPIAIMEPDGQVALANHEAPYYKSVTAPGVNSVLAAFALPDEAAALDAGAATPRREWSLVSGLQREEPIPNDVFRSKIIASIEAGSAGTVPRADVEQRLGAYAKGDRFVCQGMVMRQDGARSAKIIGSVNVRDRLVTLALSRAVENESDIASAKAKCVAWAEAMVKANR